MGRSGLLAASVAAVSLTAVACSPASASGSGGNAPNLLHLPGGADVAARGPAEVPCPAVAIAPGGAAITSYTGGREGSPESLRSQLSITNVARECTGRADGSTAVKVGVEGRALIGLAGSAGRFETPVRFAIKRGERVLASVSRRAAVTLAPGETQGSFIVVEESLVVPAGIDDFDIEVALGGGAAERPARRTRR